ncbi:TrkH family potassium uptake protein [Chitinivibrio alkaliphilus]|uniref:Potassium uptake protein, TrkH family n=1 Tax=Chitinivibrio alkaliphilus ACht1 TaxID=1313304 RepID=U7D7P4_9BACT|nr:potassium transporter TrkG [Chitinivibrio alkaliphilus]ERP31117.1 potassium uptake protein, TrkH family [Chitinivibrio alkaliphilus ACht1]
MNNGFVIHTIGSLLQLLGVILLIPLGIAVLETPSGESLQTILSTAPASGFFISCLVTVCVGTLFKIQKPPTLVGNGIREGFAIVTFGWIFLSLFSAIPLWVYFMESSGTSSLWFHQFTDAFFESMSGFTTTGSTILRDIEALPKSLLFWRSMTHWLGGMGIVTLVLAIFPASGITAYQMFRGEVPGPTAEKIGPQLGHTTKVLWGVYILLTLAETLLLTLGGMTLFDALCHSFGTMATGGFSTKNASIGYYDSVNIDTVITIFMFLAGMNFMLHYALIFQRSLAVVTTNREFRFYAILVAGAILFSTVVLRTQGVQDERTISSSYRSAPLSSEEIHQKIDTEQE